MLEGCLVKLPPAFAAFLVRKQKFLESQELGRGGLRTVGWKKTKLAELPIEVFCFQFLSPESLMQCLEYFALWVDTDEAPEARGLLMSG